MKRRLLIFVFSLFIFHFSFAQDIPEPLQYTEVYDFLDELATEGVIHINSAVKPYSRHHIATLLQQAQSADSLLNKRQKKDLAFYLNNYALERDTIPHNWVQWTSSSRNLASSRLSVGQKSLFNLSLAQPSFHTMTKDKAFKMLIKPILGMDVYANKKGAILKRWYGAEIQATIVNHVSIWGSLRDVSWYGDKLLKESYFPNRSDGARLTKPQYLNNLAGVQYKEANYGGDFSDSRGGISAYTWWGSISLQREIVQWGDAYHCSNILSGHNPAVPMLSLRLTPCRWFEFNYMHAWLVSNVIDSTYTYTEQYREDELKQHFRPANKYMAANMFTFIPVKGLNISIGNSIIYAERNPQAAYFIPIAFYKSLDHLLTKGLAVENQNSQVFFTINTRNLKHFNFYGSVYLDEFSAKRLKRSNPQRNPVSYVVGASFAGWNVSAKAEFMRSNIACYTHSIDVLSYTSNSYNMGHYMGDNAQNIYAELKYNPVRGLSLKVSYTNDTKYNKYDYVRREIGNIIAQKPYNERIYQNDTFAFDAVYEVFNNCYAVINLSYNNARAFAPTSERIAGEDRGQDAHNQPLTGEALQAYYLNTFCPIYLQGKNLTFMCGLSFNF